MTPKLSVIIVNHHSAEALEHCLRSLHVATDVSVEIIVVDNSPPERTKNVLQESKFHGHYIPQSTNVGGAAAANVGVEHAAGEYLCFVHPDVLFDTHSLDRLLTWVEQHPRTIAGPRERDRDGNVATTVFPFVTRRAIVGAHHPKTFWPRSWQPLLPWLVPEYRYAWQCRTATEAFAVPVLSGSCLVLAHEVWQDIGPFNEEVEHFGLESEWFRRARDLGYSGWYVPEAIVYHDHRSSTQQLAQVRGREGKDRGRRWHAKRFGFLMLVLLAVAVWVERRIEPRER